MHKLRNTLFASLALGALGGTAAANGFYVNEHDAKATGRGGAMVATSDGPSSIVFNPGGIAIGEGTAIAISGSLIAATGSYTDSSDNKTETDNSPAVVPSMYVTSRVHDMIAVGVGFHLPFGNAISWPDGHAQADTIQDQSLRSYFITPSVGFNLNKYVPGLSVGLGIDLVPATVKLEQAIIFGDARGTASLGGEAFGIGGRVGVQYQPEKLKQLRVGAMWRSQVNLDFDGKGDFDIDPAFRDQLPPDGDIATKIRLPQQISGGIAYNVLPELQFEFNAMWLNWKKFDKLEIELPMPFEPTVSPQNYDDTVTLRLAGEYALPKYKTSIRAAYVYDPTPIPNSTISARLPDGDRHDIALGGTYSFGNYDVHLGVLWVLPTSQTTDEEPYMPQFKGKYEFTAFVTALSFAGRFGK